MKLILNFASQSLRSAETIVIEILSFKTGEDWLLNFLDAEEKYPIVCEIGIEIINPENKLILKLIFT